jgi:hypothetical protein
MVIVIVSLIFRRSSDGVPSNVATDGTHIELKHPGRGQGGLRIGVMDNTIKTQDGPPRKDRLACLGGS